MGVYDERCSGFCARGAARWDAPCLPPSLAKIERLDISSAMHNPDHLYPVLDGSVENEVVLDDRISQVWADIRPGSAEVLIFGQQQKVLLKGCKQLGGCLQVVCRDRAPNLLQVLRCSDGELVVGHLYSSLFAPNSCSSS